MKDALLELDKIRLNFSPEGLFIVNLTLAFIMFGVALGIKIDDFKRIYNNPKPALVGILSQFILMPFLTFILAIIFRNYISTTIAFGMILVAACPGGNISNFMSALAKGNTALSVTLTAFATLGAIFLTPLNFKIWGSLYIKVYSNMNDAAVLRPLSIDAFEMFKNVLIILGIPLIIGMILATKFPTFTKKINGPIKKLSIICFIAIILISFQKNYSHFINYIQYIFIFVLIHNTFALLTGFGISSLFKINKEDRRTITIETGIQNSGLGLVLLFNPLIFPEDIPLGGMAFTVAWWAIWHIISGLSLAGYWSKKSLE